LRTAAVVALVLSAAVTGVVGWRNQRVTRILMQANDDIRRLLKADDIAAAEVVIERTEAAVGSSPAVTELRQLIDAHFAAAQEAAARAVAERRRERLAIAAGHFERGELEAAMNAYAAVLADVDDEAGVEVRAVVRARCQSLLPAFERLAQELPYILPPAPGPTVDGKARRQAIEDLQTHFQDNDLLRAKSCLRASEHEVFRLCVDADTSARLTKACSDIVRTFALADVRRTAYQSLEASAEVGRRLHPLVIQASQLEAQHRYRDVVDVYNTLVRDHPHEDELKARFRANLAKAEKITQALAAVAAATAATDYKAARQALDQLRSEFPEIPFGKLVRLPLTIETRPSGATVAIGGERVGKTPLQATYVPDAATAVQIHLEGYETADVVVESTGNGSISLTLTKRPDWVANLQGAITQTPASDGRNSLIAVDRSGRATGLALTSGGEMWKFDSQDLSGLLPRPVVLADQVVIASLDGAVRCLELADGAPRWRADGLPVEVAPVARGDLWLGATTDGRLAALDARSGQLSFTASLPGKPAGLLVHERTACCVTTGGAVVGVSLADGKQQWATNLDLLIAAPPEAADGVAFLVSEDGAVVAIDLADGKPRWQRTVPGLEAVAPAVSGKELLVAADQEVIFLSRADGAPTRALTAREQVTAITAEGDLIMIGTINGNVIVLAGGNETMRLHGPGRVTAKPLRIGAWIVVAFEGKTVQAYRWTR
jgi:outer membrane protein assembly factor BamB